MRWSRFTRNRQQRGIALLAVLWFVMLMAVLVISVLSLAKSEARVAWATADRVRAEALADGGIYLAIARLVQPHASGEWPRDGRIRSVELAGGRVEVAIQDTGGLIGLNSADEETLQRLFLAAGAGPGEASELAAAVQDWRDNDETPRSNGAEAPSYRAAGVPFAPANRDFRLVTELEQVLGMTAARYRRVAQIVTIYPSSTGLDNSVAPPDVLGVMSGIAADQAARVGEQRVGEDRQRPPFPGALLPSSTRTYRILAAATTAGGSHLVRRAVVLLTGSPRMPFFAYEWGTWHEAR